MGRAPAVVQSAPEDPAFLFSPDNYAEETYLADKFLPIVGLLGGFFGTTLHNRSQRRPFLAGLPFVVGFSLLGLGAGIWWQQRSNAYWAERDAIYRHYIELHPEDFPAKERILVADMFKNWHPIR